MSLFPNEIWLRIWSQPSLAPRDLASVCLTCSNALAVARTILYRSVKIVLVPDFQSTPASLHTLQLLARDSDLARIVTELTLYSWPLDALVWNPTIRHWLAVESSGRTVNVDAFAKLTGLKSLNLLGGVFLGEVVSEEVKDAFVDVISGLSLEKLNIVPGRSELGLSPAQLERFKNLKKLEWKPEVPHVATDYAVLWSLLSGSASSLTSLSLPFGTNLESAHHRLFTMRFPRLQSLILGNWYYDIPTTPEFNNFVISHSDTLEHLDLEYCEYDEYNLSFADDGALTPNSLPRLREFRGHTGCIRLMAECRMKCLSSSLTKLTVGPGGIDSPAWDVRRMLDAVRASGGLPALKELDLDLSQWEERERVDIALAITACAEVCPSLEIWSGTPGYGLKWTAEELGFLFGQFEKLRLIRLLDENVDGDIDRYVGVLATQCRALEEVTVRCLGLAPLGTVVKRWVIKRHDGEPTISSVI